MPRLHAPINPRSQELLETFFGNLPTAARGPLQMLLPTSPEDQMMQAALGPLAITGRTPGEVGAIRKAMQTAMQKAEESLRKSGLPDYLKNILTPLFRGPLFSEPVSKLSAERILEGGFDPQDIRTMYAPVRGIPQGLVPESTDIQPNSLIRSQPLFSPSETLIPQLDPRRYHEIASQAVAMIYSDPQLMRAVQEHGIESVFKRMLQSELQQEGYKALVMSQQGATNPLLTMVLDPAALRPLDARPATLLGKAGFTLNDLGRLANQRIPRLAPMEAPFDLRQLFDPLQELSTQGTRSEIQAILRNRARGQVGGIPPGVGGIRR